jgi:hypothetical protein
MVSTPAAAGPAPGRVSTRTFSPCPARRAAVAGRWAAAALVAGDALVDAAVDFGADPLD